MKGNLYLRLDYPRSGEVVWRTTDGENGSGTLAEVATLATGRRTVVFIAGTEVLLLEALVPTRKRERLQQAVPYAVEEYLAADVETLHFALGKPTPVSDDATLNSIPVVVVARTRMDTWLATLGEAGINPQALIPDLLALPLLPASWTLLREPHTTLLRTGPYTGCAPDPAWLSLALEQTGHEPPSILRVATDDSGGQVLPLPPSTLTMEPLPCLQGGLGLLMDGYRPHESINLLQGTYSRHEQLGRLWRPWRTASALLLMLGVLQFAGLLMEKQRLSAEDLTLRTRMTDLYQRAFPDARKIVNPRVQMEQRLNALRTQPEEGSANVIGLLARVAPVLGNTETMELRALRYKDSGMELDLTIKNLQLLDRLKQRLAETGLEVDIRSARAQKDNVEGYLLLKSANKAAH